MTDNHAIDNAKAWFSTIVEMVDALRKARGDDWENDYEDAQQRIHESVLSVEVRSGWYLPGETHAPAEFSILLSTGGPALRLIGELSEDGQPETARLEHQNWGTPWTPVRLWDLAHIVDPAWGESPILAGQSSAYDKAEAYLLDFARQFYFGEG